MKQNFIPTSRDFWFLPLGGANEIGMNFNAFGHNGQWVLVDLGITFHDRLGIDIVTPDPSFFIDHADRIEGLVLTHAHEDHVGAIPYLWPYLKCPIYATPFTLRIVRQKIKEYAWKNDVPLIEIPLSSTFNVGHFEIEYITLTHSIPEPNALRITTPLGTVLHSGDWKIDPTPLIGEPTHINRLQEIGNAGVCALICDSTNVFNEGESGSEGDVRREIQNVIGEYPHKRITVACFASNVARVETIIKAAHHHGRGVALIGRSLHRMVAAAKETGYLSDLPTLLSEKEALERPIGSVLFLVTGSQGEMRSALARIAAGQYPTIKLTEKDVVFFSSRMIPGNEKNIVLMKNRLIHRGVKIVTSDERAIHVSGHPARDELRRMYEWIKPQAVIPVHGDAHHLAEHADFAKKCGIKDVVVPYNGSLIALETKPVRMVNTVHVGRWVHDGNRMIDFGSIVIKERHKMSSEGLVVMTFFVDGRGQWLKPPSVTIKGLCDNDVEYDALKVSLLARARETLMEAFSSDDERCDVLRYVIRKGVQEYFNKKPIVDIHVMQVHR
jgi:ribonuclease J